MNLDNSQRFSSKLRCPACSAYGSLLFFDGGLQPLATLGWPESSEAATGMPRFPLKFVSCLSCSHVYNEEFEYENVPYSNNPNRMYNDSSEWNHYLGSILNRLADELCDEPTVLEIGCGAGLFLKGLSEKIQGGKFVGFDPNGCTEVESSKVEFRKEFFDPVVHVKELEPDLVICRHVVEHLIDPLELFQPIVRLVELGQEHSTKIFVEVPCIDAVFDSKRTADFFYEHVSNFTSRSFTRFLEALGGDLDFVEKGYGGEVIFGQVNAKPLKHAIADQSNEFYHSVRTSKATIQEQLDQVIAVSDGVAIWGGSGKAASFINTHGLDDKRFPIVVDSDEGKVGFFVPGTGQEIKSKNQLISESVDTIIIPMQWRAKDILDEIHTCGIPYRRILIEHNGRLVDLEKDENPYCSKLREVLSSIPN